MLQFETPWFFLLLLLLPLFYGLRKAGFLKKETFPLILSDWQGLSFKWKSGFSRFARFLSCLFIACAFLCAVVALCEPVITRQEKQYLSQGAEVFFVVDTSPSMAALDMGKSTRLQAAKEYIRLAVNSMDGASFALIAMARDAALVVPSTMDHQVFLNRLDSLVIGEMGDGTAIGVGISSAVYHAASSQSPKKCIVVITDGENNAGQVHPNTAARLAAEKGITLYVLGLGTGGTVPLEYVDPKTGKVYSGYFDSAFDQKELLSLAQAGKGEYFSAENPGLLSVALQTISARQTVVQTYRINTVKDALYDDFLYAAALLIFLAWFLRRVYLKELL